MPSDSSRFDKPGSTRRVRIDIDLQALRRNAQLAREFHGNKLYAVVKCDAYGHGAVAVAQALESTVDGFAVVTLAEAEQLRDAAVRAPILVLQGPQSRAEALRCRELELSPVLHDEAQRSWLGAQPDDRAIACWIKLDSGMGRLGLSPALAAEMIADDDLEVIGLMTHFACADEPGNRHTEAQLRTLDELLAKLALQRHTPRLLSAANSAAIMAWPAAHRDIARAGIMLYGASPMADAGVIPGSAASAEDGELAMRIRRLSPVMRVSAPLIAVKDLAAGATVGYGAGYRCPRPMRIGYVGIGYGDGLPRVLENAAVWFDGAPRALLGRVSMDSIAIDLSAIEGEIDRRQPVVIFGPEWPVEYLARAAGTISYEVLCRIQGDRYWHGAEDAAMMG